MANEIENPAPYIHNIWSKGQAFYGNTDPLELIKKYGSPLYVYNENILRNRCKELKKLINYPHFKINYSAKANTNLHLLKIVQDEGLMVDAMSPGEIFIELKAGFKPEDILFISNNVADNEMKFAIEKGILISVDSLSQLERYGKLNPGGRVAVRINPGVGAGHHEKVITGGKKTKFGVEPGFISQMKSILAQYNLKLSGINQHIGSLFMGSGSYIEAARFILNFSNQFPDLEFVDLGGGFGIPYKKEEGEKPLNLKLLGEQLQKVIDKWAENWERKITIKIEPGRFIVAECGILLGEVNTIKENGGNKYIGTDIGFNVLIRPAMYDAHHDVEIYGLESRKNIKETVTIVGNICETGDILVKNRTLPKMVEGDVLGILDSGAYGMVMSSNYNCRLRPAEVLIDSRGNDILIRRREVLDDLINYF